MPYIGTQPTQGRFIELDSLSASATANYTLQLNSANFAPESVNNLLVSINGVIQGSSTMSLNGAVLTVGATLSSSDTIDFVRVFGNVGTVSTPTDGSVTANKIGTGAVDLTSKVSGVLPVANGGTGVIINPYFYTTGNGQSVSQNSVTTIEFPNERFDNGNYFDTSTHRYTPPLGIYKLFAQLQINNISSATDRVELKIVHYDNSSSSATTVAEGEMGQGTQTNNTSVGVEAIIQQTDANDYYYCSAMTTAGTRTLQGGSTNARTYFGGHLIG